MNIVSIDQLPEERYKLFFGDSGKFLRIDHVDYPTFKKLYETAFGSFWTWRKFDFTRDRLGWDTISPVGQRMFLLNNGYQSLMDSGVVSIYNYLSLLATNTELALAYQYIAQNESIHAASYSYGLTEMFGAEASSKIDIVYSDPVIKTRLENEVDFTDDLFKNCIQQQLTDDTAKETIIKAIVAAYMLEHIKFPFSFFVTWSVNKAFSKAIESFSLLLVEIAHDELVVHTSVNANVIKILRKETRQEFKHLFKDLDQFIIDYARSTAESEMKWNRYLQQDGPITGYTIEVGDAFIRYQTDRALSALGLDPIYNEKKNDIIEWFDMYRNSNMRNIAAQETQNINYQKGALKNDIDSYDWSKYA